MPGATVRRARLPWARLRSVRGPAGLVACAAAITLPVALLPAAPAAAASADVVVSEVYGGGGNSGATLTNDFVELYNRGTSPVDLGSWSVQYSSPAGTSWQATNLTGSIPAGAHYLVQEAKGSGGTAALPAPDATGTIAMGGTSGRIALVSSQTALGCGTACAGASGVHDLVGYGTTNDHEGAGAAPTLSNTTSAQRGSSNADTDDNAADFTAAEPTPTNKAGDGGGDGGDPPVAASVHDIQGAAHVSPLAGKDVTGVTGVVTAVASNQFFLQDQKPDDDPATSEGIAVFTSSKPTVAVGDAVTVAGTVTEFRPGGASSANLSTTEISRPTVTVGSSGNALPDAALVGPGGRVPPGQDIDSGVNGDVETSGTFDPAKHGLDFWESLEGMRVAMKKPTAVGPTSSFHELPIVARGASPRSVHGGVVQTATDGNPERIIAADLFTDVPTADVGDVLGGTVNGIVDYDFGTYRLELTATPPLLQGGLKKEVTTAQRASELSVATFNVENLAPDNPQAKFDGLARTIITNLRSPDILAVEEIQDNSGAKDDGTVAADATWNKLTGTIKAQGGPRYAWKSIDPTNDTDGGQPGGNIRVGFLYRTDRGIGFAKAPAGDATTAETVVNRGGTPALALNPGRIDPGNSAWEDSRKPLVGQFTYQGKNVFVIANHWNSKGGDDPLTGRYQPPKLVSETQRTQQAQAVSAFVNRLLAVDSKANLVVAGDLNDFPWSKPIQTLTGNTTLTDLPGTLPVNERFTYDYQGNSEVLDHILLSPRLAANYRYDVVHVNAEFADQLSDHDPQIVRVHPH